MNLHHDGVDPSSYTNNAALKATYSLLSTNLDRKGKPFGSTFEGINLPFYATQWHPERFVALRRTLVNCFSLV